MKKIILFLMLVFSPLHAASDYQPPQTFFQKSCKFTRHDPVGSIAIVTAIIPLCCTVGMLFGASSIEECLTYGAVFFLSYATSCVTECCAKTKAVWFPRVLNFIRKGGLYIGGSASVLKLLTLLPKADAAETSLVLRARNCTIPDHGEVYMSEPDFDTFFHPGYLSLLKERCLSDASAAGMAVIDDNRVGVLAQGNVEFYLERFTSCFDIQTYSDGFSSIINTCLPSGQTFGLFMPTNEGVEIEVVDSILNRLRREIAIIFGHAI